MKSKLSIMLFGLSFLIALLGEAYLLTSPRRDLFSITGIGIVVILTGYLWFDTLWEYISGKYHENALLWEKSRKLEAEKWNTIHTEILNIQKATYSALKKSVIKTEADLNRIINLLEKIDEGQSKTLNITVNCSKEQSKEIIEAIREECKGNNYEEQLKAIIALLHTYAERAE